jgi:hypothetical protein
MDVRFCEQQEPSPRGTNCELGNFAIMRLARSPRRARRIVFSLDIDLSWMSAIRTEAAKTTGKQPRVRNTALRHITPV